MKTITTIFVIALIAIMSQSIYAQNSSVWVVYSQNKCHAEYLDDMRKAATDKWGPVLDEVVAEGKWSSWGVLEHAWGDEWNWNPYYVAESREAFFEGWNLMIKKMQEKYPEYLEEVQKFCYEHKDSMYIQRLGSGIE